MRTQTLIAGGEAARGVTSVHMGSTICEVTQAVRGSHHCCTLCRTGAVHQLPLDDPDFYHRVRPPLRSPTMSHQVHRISRTDLHHGPSAAYDESSSASHFANGSPSRFVSCSILALDLPLLRSTYREGSGTPLRLTGTGGHPDETKWSTAPIDWNGRPSRRNEVKHVDRMKRSVLAEMESRFGGMKSSTRVPKGAESAGGRAGDYIVTGFDEQPIPGLYVVDGS